jgi:hypothetical protein
MMVDITKPLEDSAQYVWMYNYPFTIDPNVPKALK